MPPKTITCSICGKEVMKSQTSCIGKDDNGNPIRACKEHNETEHKANQYQEIQENTKKYNEEKERTRESKYDQFSDFEYIPRCMLCQKEGIFAQEWGMMNLVALKVIKKNKDKLIKTKIPEIPDRIDVLEVTDSDLDKIEKWKARFKRGHYDMIRMVRVVHLCWECQDKVGIKMPMPKLEVMQLMGALYKGSDLEKEVGNVADMASIVQDSNIKIASEKN